MPKQQDLRTLVDRFVSDLSAIVHEQALDSVREALGEPTRRGPGRPRGSGKRGPGRPRKAGKRGPGRPRKAAGRVRRSSADLEATAAKVLAYVRSNPGKRLEEIGKGLRMDTAGLKRPLQALLADGKLRTEGQKRGTRYFAGGRGGPGRKAGKRRGARKAGKRAKKAAKARGRRGAKATAITPAVREPARVEPVAAPEAVQAA